MLQTAWKPAFKFPERMDLLCRAIIEIDAGQWPELGCAGENRFSRNVTAPSFHTLWLNCAASQEAGSKPTFGTPNATRLVGMAGRGQRLISNISHQADAAEIS
jgi:hypothetical protein